MTVLTVVSIPNTEDLPDSTPQRIVSQLPSIDIQVVNLKRQETTAIAYFWMRGVPIVEFKSVLKNDPQIVDVQQLEQTEEGGLFKAEWIVDSPAIHCIGTANGLVKQAHGTAEEWQLKIWFEDRADASAFQQCCNNHNIPLDIIRLSSLADSRSDDFSHVTQRQHEAMTLAYQEGYFDEPRRISQDELGDELGISSSAVGRRLRRGFSSLIEETLID